MIVLITIYVVAIFISLFSNPLLFMLLMMFFGPFALLLVGIDEIRDNNY